jgi:tetratricopeptide (TPR) repeat protein
LESAAEKTFEGEFAEARDYLERIFETDLGENAYGQRVQDQALEILAAICAFEAKWDEAEQTLERLRGVAPIGNQVLSAMHMVARAHLNGKSYENALKWCNKARYWWKKTLGDQSVFYYLSTNLLAEFCEARDDILSAKSFRRNLPRQFEDKLRLIGETYRRMSSY